MTSLLEVNNLTTEFRTAEGIVQAVNGISYELKEGEILGIVGESGSGKSVGVLSLLQLIPQPPGRITDGQVLFDGDDLLRMSDEQIRRIRGNLISMIFQDPMTSLNPVLKIGRQLGEALELHMGMTHEQARARSIELLELVGIPLAEKRVDQYPHQLSGGMRQRVMIAMGLACKPRLLIADEPTTALDVTIQAQIIHLVRGLQEEIGMAVIWITHDLGVVAGLADRVIVMYSGYIVESAPVDDLYEDARHPYTLGLMGSLPSVDADSDEELHSIKGSPPDLTALPPGCPFTARCPYVVERCHHENPPLEPKAPGHLAACWVDVKAATPVGEAL
jgi:oligopeptide transport system ATP-binding protein